MLCSLYSFFGIWSPTRIRHILAFCMYCLAPFETHKHQKLKRLRLPIKSILSLQAFTAAAFPGFELAYPAAPPAPTALFGQYTGAATSAAALAAAQQK